MGPSDRENRPWARSVFTETNSPPYAPVRLAPMPPVSYGTRSGDFAGFSRVFLNCTIGWRQLAQRTSSKLTARL